MRTAARALDPRVLLGPDLIVASGFLVVLLSLAMYSPRPLSFWHASVMMPLAILGVLLAIALVRGALQRERSPGALLRGTGVLIGDWLPLVIAVLVYENIHDLTYVIRPSTVDGALRAIDERFLGATPAMALDRVVAPWLTDVMSGAYALYFVYPAALLILAYRRGDLVRFREVSLALGLCLYLGLLGYVLVPAIGPRYAFPDAFTHPLVGPYLTAPAARAWNAIELVDRDCFPSLHTALTALALIYFVRLRRVLPYGRTLVKIIVAPIVLLWVSTMYLRYHYAVDVLAGFVLAGLVAWLAPRLQTRYRLFILGRAQRRGARSPASVRAGWRRRHRAARERTARSRSAG
jgi:membrane-associated phospholipid phosphatase